VTRLGYVLDEERRRSFAGRADELAHFDEVLRRRGTRRILFLHGPGGVGKTTLLHELRARAQEAGRTAVVLDGRELDATSDAVEQAWRADLGGANADRDLALFVDGYERLASLDRWFRDGLLATLPVDTVVAIAGRSAPEQAWRTDPGWRALVRIQTLGPLSTEDSDDLLRLADVPAATRPKLVELGRGHPLTLALLADVASRGQVPQRLADVPDIVVELVKVLFSDVPSDTHALGLATCALSWVATEDVLRSALGDEAARDIWGWLQSRPFMVCTERGIYPHDLVCDVLETEFRTRSPDAYRRLHHLIHDHVVARLRGSTPDDRSVAAHQLMYLHRSSPLRDYWALREDGSATVAPARIEDHHTIVSMLGRFEGDASTELAERWLESGTSAPYLVRHADEVVGSAVYVMPPSDSTLCDADPLVREVLDHVDRVAPLRSGEQVSIGRFITGVEDHHRGAYAVLVGTVSAVMEWMSRPLAWSFVIMSDPEFWDPIFEYAGFTERLAVEFDGRVHVAYGNDWRRLGLSTWLEMMRERELSGEIGPPPSELLRPAPLDRTSFDGAVRATLRDLQRPDRLLASPLLGTSLAEGPGGRSVDQLRTTLLNAIEHLGEEPRSESLGRVLDRTFLHGTPTQEAAAELLGLPFSTYRRHLAKGLDRLTDLLWAVEIGEVRLGTRR
jgi:RecA/RadA recombinase